MIAIALDAILVLVVIEGLVLAIVKRRTGKGIAPKSLLGMLGAGAFLMLGLRLALGGAGDGPIAACLLGSLIAHVADLASRWRE